MHPREEILGLAEMYRERGEPIPVDILARAEALGLYLNEFERSRFTKTYTIEGILNGSEEDI